VTAGIAARRPLEPSCEASLARGGLTFSGTEGQVSRTSRDISICVNGFDGKAGNEPRLDAIALGA
jgi:hypothetical protein